jgi:uncharacterized protein (DUF362 family)
MGPPTSSGSGGITRRGFLLGSAFGLTAGAGSSLGLMQLLRRHDGETRHFTGRSVEVKRPAAAIPGPFPGRVVEVRHPDSVTIAHDIRRDAVKVMMDRGMIELTGADLPLEAWKRFFEPGDVVGVKVNPVGRKRRADGVGSISSPAVLLEVVENLKEAGVKPRDIIVFERYADEFRDTGYEQVMRERSMDGVRWYASGAGYDAGQLDIAGYDSKAQRRDRDPHVTGYDPDVFVEMGFAQDGWEKDERRFRSHLSLIVTRMVNKIVTIPVLKDHRSAGVTLALKNLSHGMNNNVARSHLAGYRRIGSEQSDPNQCNTFIPTAAGQMPTREKATLHILDGLIGVYEGGPGSWNPTWGTWRRQSLFFATDPVAMDHVGWDIIDAKRAQEGWQPVAAMGKLHHTPAATLSRSLAALAASGSREAISLAAVGRHYPGVQDTEGFDRRQPEHIILASTIGMGTFDARQIDHRVIHLKA